MGRVLVIDTETGGADPLCHSILSLAGVVWVNGSIGPQFEIFVVEPTLAVTPKALEINRIDLVEHCRIGITPTEAVRQVRNFLARHFADELVSENKVTIAGHNVGFDVGFLKRLFRLANSSYEEVFSHRVLDTSGIVRYLGLANIIPLVNGTSSESFAYFGVDVSEEARHTALGDALATAELLSKLIDFAQHGSVGQEHAKFA